MKKMTKAQLIDDISKTAKQMGSFDGWVQAAPDTDTFISFRAELRVRGGRVVNVKGSRFFSTRSYSIRARFMKLYKAHLQEIHHYFTENAQEIITKQKLKEDLCK